MLLGSFRRMAVKVGLGVPYYLYQIQDNVQVTSVTFGLGQESHRLFFKLAQIQQSSGEKER